MNRKFRVIALGLIIPLSLILVANSSSNPLLVMAQSQAQSATDQPKQQQVSVGTPARMDPASLPAAASNQPRQPHQTPFNPPDRNLFTSAKSRANTTAIAPSADKAADTSNSATASDAGPAAAPLTGD